MRQMTDRFVSPCAAPEGWDREIVTIVVEECAEVQQRATKMLRFGIDEVQPGQALTNAQRLGLEVGDLLESLDQAMAAGFIDPASVEAGRANKRRQLEKFMQHAPGRPCPANDEDAVTDSSGCVFRDLGIAPPQKMPGDPQ